MNTRTRPTNSAPSRKKKEASPSNANTKHSAACIRFCKVAAASAADSVNTEMMTKAAVFIRNKIFGGEIVGQAHRLRYNRRRNQCFSSFSETVNAPREFPSCVEKDRQCAVNKHEH